MKFNKDLIYLSHERFPVILTTKGYFQFKVLDVLFSQFTLSDMIDNTNSFFNPLYSLSEDYIQSIYDTNLKILDSNKDISDPVEIYKLARSTTTNLEEFIDLYIRTLGFHSHSSIDKYSILLYKDDIILYTSSASTSPLVILKDGVKGFNDESMKEILYSSLDHLYKLSYITSRYMKYHNIKMYDTFNIEKSNGKTREIKAPNDITKKILSRLNGVISFKFEKFLSRKLVNDSTTGKTFKQYTTVWDKQTIRQQFPLFAYRISYGIQDNAKFHRSNRHLINIDLKNFFPSIRWKDVDRKLFKTLGFAQDYKRKSNQKAIDLLMEEFNHLMTDENDQLYIGNPVSGVLSNMVMTYPLYKLIMILGKYDINVSAYADDISFSTKELTDKNKHLFNTKFLSKLTENVLVRDYKLDIHINWDKVRYQIGGRRRITGVTINENDELTVSRKTYLEIRAILDNLHKGNKVDIDAESLSGKLQFYLYIEDNNKSLPEKKRKFKRLIRKYAKERKENGINVFL